MRKHKSLDEMRPMEIVAILFSMVSGLVSILFGIGLNDMPLSIIGGTIIGGGFTYLFSEGAS